MVGPFGFGLLAVGVLEAAAAAGMCVGAIILLLRRRTGIWVTLVACAPALLARLLLVTGIVPALLVFGRRWPGCPPCHSCGPCSCPPSARRWRPRRERFQGVSPGVR
ncbi:hypothetical protein [Mycobacterium tilburgii]|uniref:hypothetical protein n=1 Tax=Mycobacterium tilburgii TaxID=44467 RepID=UPI001183835F|nr:hypothetical protein [Mycobacterium tilburgii]